MLFDEGVFDILDERGHTADDLCTTYLGNLVLRHPTLRQLADLEPGSIATAAPDGAWRRAPLSERHRTDSVEGWERGTAGLG
ncbi:hypothetical protein [Dactylosporangium sp. CA-092794]|uniref:hypothetical protein n=1 Tax=Dactylosporangium sp. CA-092794 TaxID=3239929 RepID=UPI003D94484C